MSKNDSIAKDGIPVLLLKTKSTPNDGYDEQFSALKEGRCFDPGFVPVLEHRFLEEGLNVVRELLRDKLIRRDGHAKYGGLIFTSQRAVDAFAKLVDERKGELPCCPSN
jgi:uroporphyrinogen-III synthase